MPSALISGITGQDGSYLAELLLSKGYQVSGLVRRLSTPNMSRIAHILDRVTLIEADMGDPISLTHALEKARPDEVYNLAAQSHVGTSFKQPVYTTHINALGALRFLEACRQYPGIKFYQASTSEMFGNAQISPQNEHTALLPVSPYGISKTFAHHAVRMARESYGLFACSGILFNHESPRRGLDFVTRKITRGLAEIKAGKREYIELGNLYARRDWGYAGDYVEAMWLMLQHSEPDDYVIATGETHSVEEFAQLACNLAGVENVHLHYSMEHVRPTDVARLEGDASKARHVLGWRPRTTFLELVAMMVQSDMGEIHEDQLSSYSGISSPGVRSLLRL